MRTSIILKGTGLLAALLPLLWGCGDSMGGVLDGGGMVPVSVVLGVPSGMSASRTIAPDHLTVANLSSASYRLHLIGSSDMGGSINQNNFTLVNGKGEVSLSHGNWTLTLTAYTVTNVAALSGSSTVSVEDGTQGAEARFMLTPEAIGTGTVRLTLYWNEEDRRYVQSNYPTQLTVALALYHHGSDNMVANSRAIWTRSNTNRVAIGTTLTYTGFRVATQSPQLAAGKYELRFTISGGNVPAGVTLAWWDDVYIEPGRETAATITIPQLVHLPETPTGFAESCTQPAGSGTYIATLSWNSMFNTNSYELEVLRYDTGATRPTSDQTWIAAIGRPTSAVYRYMAGVGTAESYTNPAHSGATVMRHVSGGLLGGQDTIAYVMRRASGEEFTARMRAVNSYGSSAWVYLPSPMVP